MKLFSIFATSTALFSAQAAAEGLGLRGHQPQLSGQETPNPSVFEAAMTLEDFKNVDPNKFEWVNADEIKAGETTCGFLKAPLVWEIEKLEIEYPAVKTCKRSSCFLSIFHVHILTSLTIIMHSQMSV